MLQGTRGHAEGVGMFVQVINGKVTDAGAARAMGGVDGSARTRRVGWVRRRASPLTGSSWYCRLHGGGGAAQQ